MESTAYIDDYFGKRLSVDEAARFEQRIKEDPGFAAEVAFYVSAKYAAKTQFADDRKKRFREIYQQNNDNTNTQKPVIKLWHYVAAAAVIFGLVLGIFILMKPASSDQLADKYIQNHLQTLGVTMSSREDSMQTGLRLYNESKYAEALAQFENIIQSDTSNFTAIEYAGIVSLQLKYYDKAINWFGQLANHPGLYSNPGKFYQALTLMKRNLPEDKAKAQQLLQEVVKDNLTGKEEAEQWLKNW